MEKVITEAKLVAVDKDLMNYITYVFEVNKEDPFYSYSKWVMCVRYPNWQTGAINIGEEGYLEFIEVIAGEDKWWNGQGWIPYNYTNWQFINFVKKPNKINNTVIID